LYFLEYFLGNAAKGNKRSETGEVSLKASFELISTDGLKGN
jgi:hypothetical protein